MKHRNTAIAIAALVSCAAGGVALSHTTIPGLEEDRLRAIVAEALADAQTRSSLVDEKPVAGRDGRFFLASADGNFRLNISGEIQTRYYANFAENEDGDDFESGFQINRTRLNFEGHTINPNLRYRIMGNFNRNNGNFQLDDAYGDYKLSDNWTLRWGQFKLPFDREFYATAPTRTLGVDRSLLSSVFNLGRAQGMQLTYQQDRWRVIGAVSNGRRSANNSFTSAAVADFALTGRTEFRFGEAGWRQFGDQTAFKGDKFGVLLGLSGHYQQNGAIAAPGGFDGTIDLFSYNADIGIEGDGWNLFGAFIGRYIDDNNDSVNDYGFLVQGGVFLTEKAELFARYTQIFPDNDRPGGTDDFRAVTVGCNWYFLPKSHAAKLTAEISYYPDATVDSSMIGVPDTGVGLIRDTGGDQVGIVVQFQLMF